MTSNNSMEKGPEGNNRSNGPKPSTPQKATSAGNGESAGKSSKKRRKVNHGALLFAAHRKPLREYLTDASKLVSIVDARYGNSEISAIALPFAQTALGCMTVVANTRMLLF
jgi:hypothetical protein